jgi:hypothetical protein
MIEIDRVAPSGNYFSIKSMIAGHNQPVRSEIDKNCICQAESGVILASNVTFSLPMHFQPRVQENRQDIRRGAMMAIGQATDEIVGFSKNVRCYTNLTKPPQDLLEKRKIPFIKIAGAL